MLRSAHQALPVIQLIPARPFLTRIPADHLAVRSSHHMHTQLLPGLHPYLPLYHRVTVVKNQQTYQTVFKLLELGHKRCELAVELKYELTDLPQLLDISPQILTLAPSTGLYSALARFVGWLLPACITPPALALSLVIHPSYIRDRVQSALSPPVHKPNLDIAINPSIIEPLLQLTQEIGQHWSTITNSSTILNPSSHIMIDRSLRRMLECEIQTINTTIKARGLRLVKVRVGYEEDDGEATFGMVNQYIA